MAPGSWWPGPCLPLLYLFWNLNYPERLDFHVSIQTESEVDCEFCYCGEAAKGSVRTAQREMDIGQLHWLSAKRSYLDFCSQTIDPWDVLMISTEFWLGHLICSPVRDAIFTTLHGVVKRIYYTSPTCFTLYLPQPITVRGHLPMQGQNAILWHSWPHGTVSPIIAVGD